MKKIRPSLKWAGAIMVLSILALVARLVTGGNDQPQPEDQVQASSSATEVAEAISGQPVVPEVVEVASNDPALEERARILKEMGFGIDGGYKVTVEYRDSRTNKNSPVVSQ